MTGRAREVTAPDDRERCSKLLLARHPPLRSFLAAPSTALFEIEIVRYLHVWRFQEVRQWIPPRHE